MPRKEQFGPAHRSWGEDVEREWGPSEFMRVNPFKTPVPTNFQSQDFRNRHAASDYGLDDFSTSNTKESLDKFTDHSYERFLQRKSMNQGKRPSGASKKSEG